MFWKKSGLTTAAALAALTLLNGGCGGNAGPDGTSGVIGRALIAVHAGPSHPGEPAITPVPYKGATLALNTFSNREIGRATSDADGGFHFNLSPGTYLLVTELSQSEVN